MSRRVIIYQQENSTTEITIDRRYYQDFHFDLNLHANPEFIYVQSGELDIDIDGRNMVIPAEHYCIVLPWQIHAFRTREYSRSVVLVVSPYYVDSFTTNMIGLYGETQVFQADPAVHELFIRYLFKGPFPDEYIISSILLGLAHCFVEQCHPTARPDKQKRPMLIEAMRYISTHCTEKLTLKDVSNAMGYSYYHLSRLFRSYAGIGFSQFCNMCRIQRAQNLLLRTNLSMTDIAFECGFTNVRNFNRNFIEFLNATPSDYRFRKSKIVNGERISMDIGIIEIDSDSPKWDLQ